MKNFWRDFKAFALRGNVMDLAVGVMVGAAFQAVVASFTANILSPVLGMFGGQSLDGLVFTVEALGLTLGYGAFLTAVANFFIMAFVVFCLVRLMNRLREGGQKPAAPAPAPAVKKCPYCLTEIPEAATRCPACTSQL